ncbi:MAG: prenyltransferase/squalene oxidase repeat-containing protein [Planctomycetota bacterium]|jgi:hypothetical protein
MRSRIPSVLLILLLLGISPPLLGEDAADEKEREKKLKAGDRDPAFLLRVNTAVRKGIEWVIKQQGADGSFKIEYSKKWRGGPTALAMLALLKSGVPRADEAIEKGFTFLRSQPLQKVYSAGITIMALEARWSPQRVEERQKGLTVAAGPGRIKIPPRDLEWMKALTVFLLENMTQSKLTQQQDGSLTGPKNVWSYPEHKQGDHSNTQYAILGLRSAQRSGVRIPRGLWEGMWVKVIDHFIEVQEKDGPKVKRWRLLEDKKHGYVSYKTATSVPDRARGWTYSSGIDAKQGGKTQGDATTGSMTSVGRASLILGMEGLQRIRSAKLNSNRKSAIKKAVNDGLAWMTHHFTVSTNPGHPQGMWVYYYLYGMERAAVLAGVRNLGKHDWYREGAEWLLGVQNADGSWSQKTNMGVLSATCFSLLFLTKATIPGRVKITR